MGPSRLSSRHWVSRHWSCSSRGSSRFGHGNGISRRILSLATALVRPPTAPIPFWSLKSLITRCAIAPFVQVHRSSLRRLCPGQQLLERLCAFHSRTSAYDSLHQLRDEPSFHCATFLRPLAPTNYPATSPHLVRRNVPYITQAGNRHLCEQYERNAWGDGGNGPGVCRHRREHGRAKVELAGILDLQQGDNAEERTPGPPTRRC